MEFPYQPLKQKPDVGQKNPPALIGPSEFTSEPVQGKTARRFLEYVKGGHKDGFVKIVNKKTKGYQVFPPSYLPWADSIRNAEVRDNDVWMMSYPKSGITWAQELVWCLDNDVDLKRAHQSLMIVRFPYYEYNPAYLNSISLTMNDRLFENSGDSMYFTQNLKGRRYIKCHLNEHLAPKDVFTNKKIKMFYVIRHPKDVCVSHYHFSKLFDCYAGTFDEFAEEFMEGNMFTGPFWEHVKFYWKLRNEPNMYIISYERMKKELRTVIDEICVFLDKKLTEEQIKNLMHHVSFEQMKNNPLVNYEPQIKEMRSQRKEKEASGTFMRKGEAGDHKNHMSPELEKKFEKWVQDNIAGTDIVF